VAQKTVSKPAAKAVKAPAAKKVVAPKVVPAKKVAPPVKAKAPVKAVVKAAVAPKTVAAPKAKPVSKEVTPPVKAVVPKNAPVKTVPVVAPVPVPAPVVIEPTPRPLGKRAAKKMMMEQMTQAAVVPTHAPNAAKATFSLSNERVMTSPAPSAIKKDPKRANNWKSLPVEQLTDQDVQSMPDSEYMNDVQLAFFRRKLTQLKEDMLANAGETTEHLREDTVVVPDPADRATIEEEHALELRTRDRERKLLKKIEQAIARIDAGDYGYCEETGEAIGVGRLMARPTASLSLEAQQRRELKQKMFGD
jgi:DnaK suppressor protein